MSNRLIPAIPNYTDAAGFLARFSPEGPWTVTAIHPSRKDTAPEPPEDQGGSFITTRTFEDEEELHDWLVLYGEHRNVYFTVNPLLRPMSKKPSREDVRELAWLHVDIDPRVGEDLDDEHGRILGDLMNPPDGVPPPTVITFSGGGYQAFWKLREPMEILGQEEVYEEAKRYNQQLELLLGGDNCHNVDRIMRLPGTVNRPDKKKQAKGRKESLARLIEWHPERDYPLEQFKKAPLVADPRGNGGDDAAKAAIHINFGSLPRVDDLTQLTEYAKIHPSARIIIAQGRDPDDPGRHGDSRSEWLFYVCCELVRAGCSDDTIAGIITDPDWAISESVLDKGKMAERYVRRQIERARASAAPVDEDLQRDDDHKPYQTLANFELAVKLMGLRLEYDDFADRCTVTNLPGFGPFLDDAAGVRIWLELERQFGLRPGKDKFLLLLEDMARSNVRHPVREYLDDLEWDGRPRLDLMLTNYFNAEDTPLHRAYSRLVMVAAVRRVRQPGCKFDEMLVLESKQGTQKSTALSILAGSNGWFSDDVYLGGDAKRQMETTTGRWIVEAAELDGMRKNEVESLKAWLSRTVDRARLSYARFGTERKRQFIVIGTTNQTEYLRDSTGNRRFWPVSVGEIDVKALKRDRDQLWAEAAYLEARGESIRLDPALWQDAGAAQEAREVGDPFLDILGEALGRWPDMALKMKREGPWAILGIPAGQRTTVHQTRVQDAMRRLGWSIARARFEGGNPIKCYVNRVKPQKGFARAEVEVREKKGGGAVVSLPGSADDQAFG